MADPIPVPEEYQAFDFGFSAVDAPVEGTVSPPSPTVEIDPEVSNKLELIHNDVKTIARVVYEMRESDDERATEAELRDKIRQLEAIIVPLLNNLLKTADKDYIYWPNREEVMTQQLQRVLNITRG